MELAAEIYVFRGVFGNRSGFEEEGGGSFEVVVVCGSLCGFL